MYCESQCMACMYMLIADDSESLSLQLRLKLLHRLMKSVTDYFWHCLAPVSSIMLTILLVLKKRFRNSLSSCVQLSMESGSNSVYYSNTFPLSDRSNCLTM
ncbi:hypothetical protein LIER_22094 [Lithospermum erythrorhizon]|uniref:Uncharacterized protein n=1 Tax=Lithospermum erythrorhizon TaxID=34254 RepID=A0AAV3QUW8_LITER